MALDPQHVVTPESGSDAAPGLFRRPSDAPPRLERVADIESVQGLRHELSIRQGGATTSARRRARSLAGWITGRSRRRLVLSLGTATVALAEHCDLLAERLMAQEEITADVAATLGEELARLRAEVLHLQALTRVAPPSA
ncbi:MAG TPA: hypothetical protein VGG09_00230 [Acidimicrobiales bacterium]|jgi:hypothetical protein